MPPKPLALTDKQLTRLLEAGRFIPSRLHQEFLERIAGLLRGKDFGDGDVARAVALASREITEKSRHREPVIDGTARAEPAMAKGRRVGAIGGAVRMPDEHVCTWRKLTCEC
jgi:hypothetical protein